jgi:5-methyltetrahydrofolate corrinoid/iron sulfur protein methyltransferase
MILIGESLNVMSKTLRPAMRSRDAKPIQEMAAAQQEAGADYLDLNIGPARKGGPEMMEWLVTTVQEAADLPLFLDTTNVEAMEAGLRAHKGQAVINSISCRPERMDALLPLVNRYDACFVGLLIGVEGIPRDADERAMMAAEMQARMAEEGVSEDRVFFDPIVLPVSSQQDQVVSNGTPTELRAIVNESYLAILLKSGLDSAIVNIFEKELVQMAREERPELLQLIHRVVDGEDVDMGALSPVEADYVKTTRLLLGESLYSHSWLKL